MCLFPFWEQATSTMLQKNGSDRFVHNLIPVTLYPERRTPAMTTEQWERENQDILKTMYETGGYGVRQFRCGYCRKLLYTQTYNRKYCRYETCGHKALNLRNSIRRRRARGELTCACCGKSFDPVRADARFCSNACRQKSYRQRAAEATAQ